MELPLQVQDFVDMYLIFFAAEERLTDQQIRLPEILFTRLDRPSVDQRLINLLDARPGAFPELVEHPASFDLRQHAIHSMAVKDALESGRIHL